MLYRITGEFHGYVYIEDECMCCGSYIEKEKLVKREVDEIVEAHSSDAAFAKVEQLLDIVNRDMEWSWGPYIKELPTDQVLSRLNAPMLFTV